jgi:two-component system sensor histidine kinase QseC
MTLATLVTQEGERLELEFADEFMPQYSRAEAPLYFEIWRPDGSVLERSYSLGGHDLPFQHGPPEAPRPFRGSLAGGAEVRGVGIAFPPRIGQIHAAAGPVVIAVAAPSEQVDAALRRGYRQVALTGILVVACISAVAWLALRSGVQLITRVVGEVERITPGALDRPLDEADTPEELRPIVSALNRCLSSIRGFVARERRFTADVAHELRTPISELRAAADVALRWPDEASHKRLATDARAIALQMGGLLEGLLELAVLESDETGAPREEFELSALARRVLEQLPKDAGHQRAIELVVDAPLRVRSHPQLWEVTLRNLLDNAIEYSPAGSSIRVRLCVAGAGALLCVSNPTDSLRPADLARCTERLWRAERGPHANGHHGLGLSIVQAACAKLGCTLSLRLEDGTFSATVAPSGAVESDKPGENRRRPVSAAPAADVAGFGGGP